MNISPDIIKLLEGNIMEKVLNFDIGDDILDMALKAHATKAKINARDCIKLKSFCTTKEKSAKQKATLESRENICKLHLIRG